MTDDASHSDGPEDATATARKGKDAPPSNGETEYDPMPTESSDASPDRDAPLGELASDVEQRRERGPSERDEELFTEEELDEIDTDVVWEQLDGDEPTAEEFTDDEAAEVRVVDKSTYCERCPFFATPPEVHCTHDGTDILALVDTGRFRVRNCPKVAENDRLEQL